MRSERPWLAIKIVTTYIHPDEPCWGLREGPKMVDVFPNTKEWHWVQRVYVLRGDAIAEYSQDFGDADNFSYVTPLDLISDGCEDTVGMMQEEAEKHRHDNYWDKRRQELLAESTLISDWHEQLGERHEVLHNRSVFGPGVNVQRGDYSRERSKQRLKERINGTSANHSR